MLTIPELLIFLLQSAIAAGALLGAFYLVAIRWKLAYRLYMRFAPEPIGEALAQRDALFTAKVGEHSDGLSSQIRTGHRSLFNVGDMQVTYATEVNSLAGQVIENLLRSTSVAALRLDIGRTDLGCKVFSNNLSRNPANALSRQLVASIPA